MSLYEYAFENQDNWSEFIYDAIVKTTSNHEYIIEYIKKKMGFFNVKDIKHKNNITSLKVEMPFLAKNFHTLNFVLARITKNKTFNVKHKIEMNERYLNCKILIMEVNKNE